MLKHGSRKTIRELIVSVRPDPSEPTQSTSARMSSSMRNRSMASVLASLSFALSMRLAMPAAFSASKAALTPSASCENTTTLEADPLRVELNEGDVLYIPRGAVHEASCGDEGGSL